MFTALTEAVMREGDWHIIPSLACVSWASFDRQSVIVHNCPSYDTTLPGTDTDSALSYWTMISYLKTPCKLCGECPPDSIASLWLLHNFDEFVGENDTYRLIGETIRKPGNSTFYSTWRSP
jgi:hypothetical protein